MPINGLVELSAALPATNATAAQTESRRLPAGRSSRRRCRAAAEFDERDERGSFPAHRPSRQSCATMRGLVIRFGANAHVAGVRFGVVIARFVVAVILLRLDSDSGSGSYS